MGNCSSEVAGSGLRTTTHQIITKPPRIGASQTILDDKVELKPWNWPPTNPILCRASTEGHIESICNIIESLQSSNSDRMYQIACVDTKRGKDGCSALHLAAYYGNYDACRILLNAGATPQTINYNGLQETPFTVVRKKIHEINHLISTHKTNGNRTQQMKVHFKLCEYRRIEKLLGVHA